ncbi:hypothetical protein JTB14_030389 [Gonioctena quinquepunctata]|nr:hypothetical protein JTB14_030389 [Gonioctena quinquepunctata]
MNVGEIENILSFFRDYLPEFPITKENLLRPTPELVFKFYSKFISEYHERASFLVGTSVSVLETDSDAADTEERLLQKLTQRSKLFEKGMRFLHGDIYEPTVVRTKNLFKICVHFLAYTEHILDDTERLGTDIIKMRENTMRIKEEMEQLTMGINESARKKAEAIERNKQLTDELKVLMRQKEEYEAFSEEEERREMEKCKQIEAKKQKLEKLELSYKRLELQEKDYAEQTITESEYENLLQMVEDLEVEIKTLGNDDIDMADILSLENNTLEHYQACIKRLPDISEFDIERVKKLITCEEQLSNMEVDNEKLVKTKLPSLVQSRNQKEKLLKECVQSLAKAEIDYKANRISFKENLEELTQRLRCYKDELDSKIRCSNKNISCHTDGINKLKSDLQRLRECFCQEYVKVCKAEKLAADKFAKHISGFLE